MKNATLRIAVITIFLLVGLSAISLGMKTLLAADPCPGDVDCDGTVDGSDLATIASDFGTTGCSTVQQGLPVGAIIMWSGVISEEGHPVIGEEVLTDWHICDGSVNSQSDVEIPDLVDRFVLAAARDTVNDTGGSDEVTLTVDSLPSHTHDNSFEIQSKNQAHSHSVYATSFDFYYMVGPVTGTTYKNLSAHEAYTISNTTGSSNTNHTHGITGGVLSEGGSQPFDNRPSFYSLAFIIKVQ